MKKRDTQAVAIVGSRDFGNEAMVRAFVRTLPEGTTIVSGGARGVDQWAALEAIARDMPLEVFPAEWNRYGKRAGFLRNGLIVDRADRVVAFWDGSSRGTKHTIDLARKAGKPVTIVGPAVPVSHLEGWSPDPPSGPPGARRYPKVRD